jgi:uncharacterized protein YaaQ
VSPCKRIAIDVSLVKDAFRLQELATAAGIPQLKRSDTEYLTPGASDTFLESVQAYVEKSCKDSLFGKRIDPSTVEPGVPTKVSVNTLNEHVRVMC